MPPQRADLGTEQGETDLPVLFARRAGAFGGYEVRREH